MPIKVLENNNSLLDLEKQVLIRKGIVTGMIAISHFSNKSQSARHVYQVLLDSGSDVDLAFVQMSTSDTVPFKMYLASQTTVANAGTSHTIPIKTCLTSQKWCMSNCTYVIDKVDNNLEVIFQEFSESSMVSIRPDIIELPKLAPQPANDLFL